MPLDYLFPKPCLHTSTARKPLDDLRNNEDAFIAKPAEQSNQSLILGISDGAGGMGIWADQWSTRLVEALPNLPITLEDNHGTAFQKFNAWFGQLADTFEAQANELCANDPFKTTKFNREGTAATLISAYFFEQAQGLPLRLIVLAYGDSGGLIFDKTHTLKHVFPNVYHNNPQQFLKYPNLLNCKQNPNPDHFFFTTLDFHKDDLLILCSDALFQHLYTCYLLQNEPSLNQTFEQIQDSGHVYGFYLQNLSHAKLQPFLHYLEALLNAHRSGEQAFQTYCYELQAQKLLPSDDYTLISLTFNYD